MKKSKDYLSEYINRAYDERERHPDLREKRDNITDFIDTIQSIWCISNKEYQQKIWVDNECDKIWDSYDDTTMYFGEDADILLKARDKGEVRMTDKQYEMIKKLNTIVDVYDDGVDGTDSAFIVNDPKWDEIREYAKLVYKEITGEDA